MSPRYPSLVAAFLACTSAVHAVRPAAAPAEAPKTDTKLETPKSTEPVPPYELKNRSSFANPVDMTRAPFWPIGWLKRAKNSPMVAAQQVEAPKVALDARSFRITSILIGSGTTPSLAVINGRAYSEGEFIRMPKTPGVVSPRVRVQRITDGSVILENANQTLVASPQRAELSNPKPEILLNDQDR
ncbi:MAG TPA: hypothetical protein VK961_06775 [Chthoniobacter sp.]|nr:hypothetical protein [Chthoniobacter sp.]